MLEQIANAERGIPGWIDRDITGPRADVKDPHQEWRRFFSELYGTFLLVLAAAGGGMTSQTFPNTISRTAAVVAPASTVMGIILFMGKVSPAHQNAAVGVAFPLRGRPSAPGAGLTSWCSSRATASALFLQLVIGVSTKYGSNYPAADHVRRKGHG